MVTLAILMLMAVSGLVLDVGLAYYYKRSGQVAADAAAQAGAQRAFEMVPAVVGNYPALGADNAEVLQRARTYATLNGFTQGGRQTMTVHSGSAATAPPDLAGLQVLYWVEVVVQTRVPSLFILASGAGAETNPAARAVGAVLNAPLPAQVIMLNRACDPDGTNCVGDVPGGNNGMKGINLDMGGNSTLRAPGGIMMNSSADSNPAGGRPDKYAAEYNGGPDIISPSVMVAQDGNYKGRLEPGLVSTYTNGPQVPDPTLTMNFGKQPRVLTVPELVSRVPGNVVYGVTAALGGGNSPLDLPPGVYIAGTYSMNSLGIPQFTFGNAPVQLENVRFYNGGQPGTWIFLGGLTMSRSTVEFAQGAVVVAGAPGGTILTVDRSYLTDGNGGTYGEFFLLTKPDYRPDSSNPVSASNPLLLDPSTPPMMVQPWGNNGPLPGLPAATSFAAVANSGSTYDTFGDVDFKSGNGNGNTNLTGLKGRPPCEPGLCNSPVADAVANEYYLYQPALIWQDRRNAFTSRSKISADANAFSGLHGLIYQPRGSLMDLHAGGSNSGSYQLITGAITMSGGPDITMAPRDVGVPALSTVVALVR
jgi:hypothetical protein